MIRARAFAHALLPSLLPGFAMTCVIAIAQFMAAPPASAQSAIDVLECDWHASARNIPEPWEAHTRSFSDGKTRIAMLDTIEPAAGWAWILVLSPPEGELGGRQCRVIGSDGMGFSGMSFDQLSASYDPARGLVYSLPTQRFDPMTAGYEDGVLSFVLNQATGDITGAWRP